MKKQTPRSPRKLTIDKTTLQPIPADRITEVEGGRGKYLRRVEYLDKHGY